MRTLEHKARLAIQCDDLLEKWRLDWRGKITPEDYVLQSGELELRAAEVRALVRERLDAEEARSRRGHATYIGREHAGGMAAVDVGRRAYDRMAGAIALRAQRKEQPTV